MCGLDETECVFVTICVYVLSRTHQHPFTLLEKLLMSYLSWSQGSVISKPCRSSGHCPALQGPALAFLSTFESHSAPFDRPGTCWTPPFIFPSLALIEPQHTLAYAASQPSGSGGNFETNSESLTAGGSAARVVPFSFSTPGWTYDWCVCVDRCFCFAVRSSALKAAKSFLRRMTCSKWVPPLCEPCSFGL